MINVIGTIFSSNEFTWIPKSKTFVGDRSDFPDAFRQLWNESMDLGFGIQSARTGRTVFFVLNSKDTDSEGEVQAWTFKVYNRRGDPALEGLTVTIFND